ncbi:AIDA-I family autotransporter YfaL, partial [Escherichia marmotae]|nr:AIDA-I family autotransporter YfaL [Escherichia marmotae]
MNKKWIVFIRKEYLLIFLAVVACAFTRANAASQIMPSCQGVNVIASCRASRQSLSGSTQVWNVADGQWLIFSSMKNDTSGGAVFLQQGANFTLSAQDGTGMTLFENNTVSGEYNNGGAIFAKENSTLNLTQVIFDSNVAGGYGGAIYSAGTNDVGDIDLSVTNAVFTDNIANDG